jgi:hypothetical protein
MFSLNAGWQKQIALSALIKLTQYAINVNIEEMCQGMCLDIMCCLNKILNN